MNLKMRKEGVGEGLKGGKKKGNIVIIFLIRKKLKTVVGSSIPIRLKI